MNRNYASVKGGRVVFDAPDSLKLRRTVEPEEEGGEPVERLFSFSNPTPEQYAEAGYLPVVEAERPEDGDGYRYEAGYELVDDHIVQVWERREVEPPDPNPEISADRALNIILTGRDSYEAE